MAFIYRDGIKYTAIVDIYTDFLPEHYINEHAIYRRYEDDEPHYWVHDSQNDKWTELSNNPFEGATIDEDGKEGEVPQPLAREQDKFLKGNGGWENVTGLTYDEAQPPSVIDDPISLIAATKKYYAFNEGCSIKCAIDDIYTGIPGFTGYCAILSLDVFRDDPECIVIMESYEPYGGANDDPAEGESRIYRRVKLVAVDGALDVVDIEDNLGVETYIWRQTNVTMLQGPTQNYDLTYNDGKAGIAPAPMANELNHFLSSMGEWDTVKGTITGTSVRNPGVLDNPIPEIIKVKRYFNTGESCALELPVNGSYSLDGDTWVTGQLHIVAIRAYNNSFDVYETIEQSKGPEDPAKKHIRACSLRLPNDPATIDLNEYASDGTWTRHSWKKINYPDVLKGATESADGKTGLAPKPVAREEDYFLKGNGKWMNVSGTIQKEVYDGDILDNPIRAVAKVKRYFALNETCSVEFPVDGTYTGIPGVTAVRGVVRLDVYRYSDTSTCIVETYSQYGEPIPSNPQSGACMYCQLKFVASNGDAVIDITDNAGITTSGWRKVNDIPVFEGSTSVSNGEEGIVPAPTSNELNHFLNSDGNWETVKGTITGSVVRDGGVFNNPISEIVRVKRYFNKGDSCALEVPVNGSYSIDGDTWITGILHIMAIRMYDELFFVYETIEQADSNTIGGTRYIRLCTLALPDDPATVDLKTYLHSGTWTRYAWQKINYPKVFGGATIDNNGKDGLVPAPNAADFNDILCADGKWDYPHIGSKTGDYISLDGDGPYNKYVGPVVDEIKDDDDIKYLTKIVSFPAHEFYYSNKFGQCVMEIVLNKDRKSIVLNETLTVNHSSNNGEVYYRVETLNDWDSLNYKQGGSYTSGTWIKLHSAFGGATTENDGTMGLVPKPEAGDENKFLKGDGTWAEVSLTGLPRGTHTGNTTYSGDYITYPLLAAVNVKRYLKDGESFDFKIPINGSYNGFPGYTWATGYLYVMLLRFSSTTLYVYEKYTDIMASKFIYTRYANITTTEDEDLDLNNYKSTDHNWRPWNKQYPEDYVKSTASTDGSNGLVPQPVLGTATRVLSANKGWTDIKEDEDFVFDGATWTGDGTVGIVPQPTAAGHERVLTGSGEWRDPFIGATVADCYSLDDTLTSASYKFDKWIERWVIPSIKSIEASPSSMRYAKRSEVISIPSQLNVTTPDGVNRSLYGSGTIEIAYDKNGKCIAMHIRFIDNDSSLFGKYYQYEREGYIDDWGTDGANALVYSNWHFTPWREVDSFAESVGHNSLPAVSDTADYKNLDSVTDVNTAYTMLKTTWPTVNSQFYVFPAMTKTLPAYTGAWWHGTCEMEIHTDHRNNKMWIYQRYIVSNPQYGTSSPVYYRNGVVSGKTVVSEDSDIVWSRWEEDNAIQKTFVSVNEIYDLDSVTSAYSAYYPIKTQTGKEDTNYLMANMSYSLPCFTQSIISGTKMWGHADINIYRDTEKSTVKNIYIRETFYKEQAAAHQTRMKYTRVGYVASKVSISADTDIVWSAWETYAINDTSRMTFTPDTSVVKTMSCTTLVQTSPNTYKVQITFTFADSVTPVVNKEYHIAKNVYIDGVKLNTLGGATLYAAYGNATGVGLVGNAGDLYCTLSRADTKANIWFMAEITII